MREITISLEEYKDLLYKSAVMDIFKQYVQHEHYSIPREDCARFLGFELPEEKDGN